MMPKWVLLANALPAGSCRLIDTQRRRWVYAEGHDMKKSHAFDQSRTSGHISHILAFGAFIDLSSSTVAKLNSFIRLVFVCLQEGRGSFQHLVRLGSGIFSAILHRLKVSLWVGITVVPLYITSYLFLPSHTSLEDSSHDNCLRHNLSLCLSSNGFTLLITYTHIDLYIYTARGT